MASDTTPGFALAFAGLGAGLGGFMLSGQNMVLEFGSREDLPLRIAVASSASEFVGTIGPLLGAVIAVALSHVAVFCTAIAFQLASVFVVLFLVEEPRSRRRRLVSGSNGL